MTSYNHHETCGRCHRAPCACNKAAKVEDRAVTNLEAVQITIAICKTEVEKVIGHVLEIADNGSLWGRAFLLAARKVKGSEPMTKKQFIAQLQNDAAAFGGYIDRCNEENPEAKTEDVDEADWFEMFVMFVENIDR